MTHLNLNQTTSSIEVVASSLIDKLYELAKQGLDESSNIQGNLYCQYPYSNAVNYLLGVKEDGNLRFPNLTISYLETYVSIGDVEGDKIFAKYCYSKNFGCSNGTGVFAGKTSYIYTMYAFYRGDSSGSTDVNKVLSLNFNEVNLSHVTSFEDAICFPNVTSIIMEGKSVVTSLCTNLASMFEGCANATTIGCRGWNTSNVTNFARVFRRCSNLVTIDLSDWDTRNAIYISDNYGERMFSQCYSLQTITFGINCTFEKITSFYGMFRECSSLKTINLESFITTQATDFNYMFYNCSSLVTLDLSSFITTNVTGMIRFVEGCSSLVTLDLSNFDLTNVTTWVDGYANEKPFNGCNSLATIKVTNCSTATKNKLIEVLSWSNLYFSETTPGILTR